MSKKLTIEVLRLQKNNETQTSKIEVLTSTGLIIFTCMAVENSNTLIPKGEYRAVLYASPKFGYDVLLLQDVPKRSFIEIHKANRGRQLSGCIAPNLSIDPTTLNGSNSKEPFDHLMKLCKRHSTIISNYITVKIL